METGLIAKSKSYAESVLGKLPQSFTYHNLNHTTNVAEAAMEIGKNSGLSDDDLESVVVAAWLHDTGYEKDLHNHEERSAQTATELLKSWGAGEGKILQVKRLILATRMPQNPQSIAEQVLCDADMYHLSQENIVECGEQIRQEIEAFKNHKFESDAEWREFNVNFLKNHHYHTLYGRQVLEERKRRNIRKLKKKLNPKADKGYVKDLEKELEKLQKRLDKKLHPDRGIETMFRVTAENHITLSSMADTKSNIMISVNSIILSVVVTVLFRKIEEYPNLLIPTLMLVTTCLLTIVYAILSTRPNISSGKFKREDIREKKTNLLFFGNFHGMELPNYDWGMREMMKDADYLYGSLIKDIYFNGKVLARKYKMLRVAYNIFMFGFVASIIAFTIVLLIYYSPGTAA